LKRRILQGSACSIAIARRDWLAARPTSRQIVRTLHARSVCAALLLLQVVRPSKLWVRVHTQLLCGTVTAVCVYSCGAHTMYF
jgi:hypothetical protein